MSDGHHTRVAVVGTGFAGLGMAAQLTAHGFEDFVVFERADDLGGTWRDNTYPGCACDVPSQLYSFSFAPNAAWSRAFAPQGEILAYLGDCARRRGVLPHVRFGHDVRAITWDDTSRRWHIDTDAATHTADVVVGAMGALSEPLVPTLPGLEQFEGTVFHSADWNHDHDLRGKRVAVVGTGASSIQFVPQIQPLVEKLVVFQRTAPWILPRHDRAISTRERAAYRHLPLAQTTVRAAHYWAREVFSLGFTRRRRLMGVAQRASLAHLRRQVPDPHLRTVLTPHYAMGCKRILLADDYYPAVSQANVAVVPAGVRAVRAHSVIATDGSEHEVDTIIFGTGFHVSDSPAAAYIRGRGGVLLRDAWAQGMEAYKGTAVAGFPNLFLLVGPNTGLGHTSMVYMIESQVAYVIDALRTMDSAHLSTVEVRADAQARYNDGLRAQLDDSVWSTGGCRSWYLDAQGRNTSLWPGFSFAFRRQTRRFDVAAYQAGARPDPVPLSRISSPTGEDVATQAASV